jgi:hypothetical protein
VINVPYRPHIHMRLRTVKLLLRHLNSLSSLTHCANQTCGRSLVLRDITETQ